MGFNSGFKGLMAVYKLEGGTLLVAQLVEVLRYQPKGGWFDSRWCHRNFSLT